MTLTGDSRTTSVRPAVAAALLTLFAAGSVAGLAVMWSIDAPRLAAPPLAPSQWLDWAAGRDPRDTVASLARVACTAALAFVLLAGATHAVSCLWGSASLRRRTARLAPGPLAGLIAAAVLGTGPGLGTAAGATTGAADGLAAQPSFDLPPERVDPAAPATAQRRGPLHATGPDLGVPGDDPPVMRLVGTDDADAGEPADPAHATRPVPERDPPTTDPSPMTLTVAPGDHLWGIAERRVRHARGEGAPEAEVRAYWRALIEANADRLVEPGNPDMVLPGQELVLPG